MVNDPFLNQLRALDWNLMSAQQAIELRTELLEAVKKSDEWFASLQQGFSAGSPKRAVIAPSSPPPPFPATGAPPKKAAPRPAAPPPMVKRGRGRPRKHPKPLAVGGADAADPEQPKAANLFEQSYVSKDGPRPDVGYSLPANHPRFQNGHGKPSSVTPDVDAADFIAVESMGEEGLKKFFNPKG